MRAVPRRLNNFSRFNFAVRASPPFLLRYPRFSSSGPRSLWHEEPSVGQADTTGQAAGSVDEFGHPTAQTFTDGDLRRLDAFGFRTGDYSTALPAPQRWTEERFRAARRSTNDTITRIAMVAIGLYCVCGFVYVGWNWRRHFVGGSLEAWEAKLNALGWWVKQGKNPFFYVPSNKDRADLLNIIETPLRERHRTFETELEKHRLEKVLSLVSELKRLEAVSASDDPK